MAFRPHLAGKVDLGLLDFDFYQYSVDRKYDGIRCVTLDGQVLSRSLKPIPNKFIQSILSQPKYKNLDGELIVGSPTAVDCFRLTSSSVRSESGFMDFTFYVFDDISVPEDPFWVRHRRLQDRFQEPDGSAVVSRVQKVSTLEELEAYENEAVSLGFEGIMVRRNDMAYKFGRSSNKITDQALLKLKRVASSEARIIGYECEYYNANVSTTNALGYTERSSHMDNLVPKDTLGRLEVEDLTSHVKFGIGIFRGYSAEDLKALWEDKDSLIGRVVTYDYFPVGGYDKPRHPVMKGFREHFDL